MRDVEAVLISPRALGDATAGAATAELLKLAAEQGAPRVVVLSAATVEYGGGYERFAAAFKAVEDAARTSGLPWTFLRSTDYASNSLAWVPQIRSTGIVRGAYGDGATATIHERDCGCGRHPRAAGRSPCWTQLRAYRPAVTQPAR